MIQANQDFRARIARINSGKQFEAENVVGPRTMKKAQKIRKRVSRLPETSIAARVREVFVLPFALGFGLLAVVAARAAWFHLEALEVLPRSLADVGARGEAGLAVVAAMFFVMAFRLRRGMRIVAVLTGFVLMAFGEGAFAETAPGLWQALFSPDYVAKVTQGATLASALL